VWRLLVLDEGHKVKNFDALISQAVHKVRAVCKLLLTGTPLQNNLRELWYSQIQNFVPLERMQRHSKITATPL
jgi:SNF2 family DNA or RNA helicase